MKEAFWGALVVILGLFGIIIVNIFQNVTVDNDRVYYLIKESTEAAAFDAIDLTRYRLSGDLRIVEDKFVENLTRRFAENTTIGEYTIVVEDINELPPKVSLRIRSGIKTLQGEEFGIQNRVDGIIETKYKLKDVLDFLDITEEEWNDEISNENDDKNVCDLGGLVKDDMECIPGDILFNGFGIVDIGGAVCQDEDPKYNVSRVANYKVCNCGEWEDKSEIVVTSPVKNGNEWVYTWTFTKTGELRTITQSIKEKVKINVCTTGIAEMVPKEIETSKPKVGVLFEPSTDNSSFVVCPSGGIRIPVGIIFAVHPQYIPPESINKELTWSVAEDSILGMIETTLTDECKKNPSNTSCMHKVAITAKKVGTTTVNVETSRGQKASCKVTVFDGNVDSVSCGNVTLTYGSSGTVRSSFLPKNATKTNVTWSIANSNIATINPTTGEVKAVNAGSTTVTVTSENGKTGTCKVTVNPKPTTPPPTPPGAPSSSTNIGSCSVTLNEIVGVKKESYTGSCPNTCTSSRCCGAVYSTHVWICGSYFECSESCFTVGKKQYCSNNCVMKNRWCEERMEHPKTCISECCGTYACNKVRDKEITKSVTYTGSLDRLVYNVNYCKNGKVTVTVRETCKVVRSQYYKNPGQVYDEFRNQYSYETSC